MSSFNKVLKQGSGASQEFAFGPVGDVALETPLDPDREFVAFADSQAFARTEPPAPEVDSGEQTIIAQDELQAQLDAAYRRGVADAEAGAAGRLGAALTALEQGAEELAGLKNRVVSEAEQDILVLVLAVARRVIGQEVAGDRKLVARAINAALAQASGQDQYVVRLNPEDYRLVQAHRQTYLPAGEDGRIVLKPSEEVGLGGCLLETAAGNIDARIEAQLDELARKIDEERRRFLAETPPLPASRGRYAPES